MAWLLLIWMQICFCIDSQGTTTLNLYAISNILNGTGDGVLIRGAQWLAAQEINNNTALINGYTLNIEVLDAAYDAEIALAHAIDITKIQNNIENKTYTFPLILGCQWSSLSAAVSPVLNAFSMGLISASATSISLSDTSRYPYFYRTVPSDAVQSQGLIHLCKTFNWTKIGVVYVNDAYGVNLALGIEKLGERHDIDVTTIGVNDLADETYTQAAEQIYDLKLYINVIIIHTIVGTHTSAQLLREFENRGILQYPYYYLGVDGWYDANEIQASEFTDAAQGWLGTLPFAPALDIDLNIFNDDKRDVVNSSIYRLEHMMKSWNYYYENGHKAELYNPLSFKTKTTFMLYGYDAIYTIAYALQELINSNKYVDFITLLETDPNALIQIFNDIITDNINFTGVTGHVTFDDNGDRIDGLYSYGNVKHDGSIEIAGYFYENVNGDLISYYDTNKIHFPEYFTDKGLIPQSEILTHEQTISIDDNVFWIMFCCSIMSLIFAIFLLISLICYRNKEIIKSASWKINLIMVIGAIIAFIAAILYGIDEALISNQYSLDCVCNIQIWMLTIATTVVFMPLFLKTYRLSHLFNTIIHKTQNQISDKTLFLYICICITIDISLLAIFTSINYRERTYVNGPIKSKDELQQIQYIYGQCSFMSKSYGNLIFYICLSLWKLCQIIFGLFTTLIVSRIKDVARVLGIDETGTQLLSIYCTFIIFCITCPIFIFLPDKTPNMYYILIGGSLILTPDVIILLNVFPRIWAIFRGNESKYKESPMKQMHNKLRQQFSAHKFSNYMEKYDPVQASLIETHNINEFMYNRHDFNTIVSTTSLSIQEEMDSVYLAMPDSTHSLEKLKSEKKFFETAF